MNRYFKRSHKITKIENYLNNCKLGDWFVLYQLSKNLNRPFFMDFLTTLSVRYAHGHVCDEEDPEEDGALLNQMDNYLKPSAKVQCKIAQEGYIEELSSCFYLDTALLKSSESVLSET